VDTTTTLIVRHRVQDYGAWRRRDKTLEGLLEQHGHSGAVVGPPRIEIAAAALR